MHRQMIWQKPFLTMLISLRVIWEKYANSLLFWLFHAFLEIRKSLKLNEIHAWTFGKIKQTPMPLITQRKFHIFVWNFQKRNLNWWLSPVAKDMSSTLHIQLSSFIKRDKTIQFQCRRSSIYICRSLRVKLKCSKERLFMHFHLYCFILIKNKRFCVGVSCC